MAILPGDLITYTQAIKSIIPSVDNQSNSGPTFDERYRPGGVGGNGGSPVFNSNTDSWTFGNYADFTPISESFQDLLFKYLDNRGLNRKDQIISKSALCLIQSAIKQYIDLNVKTYLLKNGRGGVVITPPEIQMTNSNPGVPSYEFNPTNIKEGTLITAQDIQNSYNWFKNYISSVNRVEVTASAYCHSNCWCHSCCCSSSCGGGKWL